MPISCISTMDVHYVHLRQVHLNVLASVFRESCNMYRAMRRLFVLVRLGNSDATKVKYKDPIEKLR